MPERTRREVLRRGGAAVAALTGGLTVSGQAQAASKSQFDHYRVKPDSVELVFDKTLLERYQPMLRITHLKNKPELGQHAWVARDTSDTHSLEALVYWAAYLEQEGYSTFDTHFGDHEPIILFRDPKQDEIVEVVYSAYHWIAGRTGSPEYHDGTHPMFYVFKPWHHYRLATADEEGSFIALKDLTQSFPTWLANEFNQDLEPGANTTPWIFRAGRSTWWRDGLFGLNATAFLARQSYRLGFDKAEQADQIDS